MTGLWLLWAIVISILVAITLIGVAVVFYSFSTEVEADQEATNATVNGHGQTLQLHAQAINLLGTEITKLQEQAKELREQVNKLVKEQTASNNATLSGRPIKATRSMHGD